MSSESSSSSSYHLYYFGGFTQCPPEMAEFGAAGCWGTVAQIDDVYDLNVSTRKYRRLSPMKPPRTNFGIASLGDKVYVLGGDNSILQNDGNNSIIVEEFDTKLNKWAELPSMLSPRSCCSAASLDDFIYVSGGLPKFMSAEPLASVDRYCVATKQWESVAPMLTPRSGHKLISYRNHLYAIGGVNEQQKNNIEKYDPSADKWEKVLEVDHSGSFDVAVHQGKFYFFEGRTRHSIWQPDIGFFDPATDTFQSLRKLESKHPRESYPLSCPSAVTIGDKIWLSENDVCSTQGCVFVEFDPATGERKRLNFGIPDRRAFEAVVLEQ